MIFTTISGFALSPVNTKQYLTHFNSSNEYMNTCYSLISTVSFVPFPKISFRFPPPAVTQGSDLNNNYITARVSINTDHTS